MVKEIINSFDAEKLHFVSYKNIEENTTVPEIFEENLISEFSTSNEIKIAYNTEQKLIRSQFNIEISTVSSNSEEAKTNLKFVFIFHCENFEELTKSFDDKIKINTTLGLAVSTITHATARGILLVKLSDTVFADFILPIVKPKLPEL